MHKDIKIIIATHKEYKIPNSNEKRLAGLYLKSGAEVLFQLLRQNPETQGMEQVMRYIMYKYTGKDYGVTTLDFSIFDPNYFTNVLTGSSLINYLKSWENDALWQYEIGKTSLKPSEYITTKDSKEYYIVYEDGSNGHNNISYGIATFITNSNNVKYNHPIYGNGYYNWQEKFAEYGLNITVLSTGDLVDKEITNAVFASIINEFETSVDNYLNMHGIVLEKSQRDALVAVKYQYGNIGNFADAYTKCGNNETLREEFKTANGAKPFSRGTNRKEANWNLFNTGVYIGRDGTEIKCGIVDIAANIHQYMEQNHYTYCVYFDPDNSCEECLNSNECYLAKTFEKSKTSKKTCCATYVSWVLQETGYLTEDEHSNSAPGLRDYLLNQKNWIKITNVSDLQPGDVICYTGHIEIYAGDSKVYNAGSGSAIRGNSPQEKNVSSMMYALRAPY